MGIVLSRNYYYIHFQCKYWMFLWLIAFLSLTLTPVIIQPVQIGFRFNKAWINLSFKIFPRLWNHILCSYCHYASLTSPIMIQFLKYLQKVSLNYVNSNWFSLLVFSKVDSGYSYPTSDTSDIFVSPRSQVPEYIS